MPGAHKLMYHTKEILENKPVCLTVDLSGKCNLKCDFCFSYKHPRKDLDIEIIKNVVDNMPTLKSVEIGMGEPILHPQFGELVNWLTNKGLSVGVGSNGYYLDNIDKDVLAKLSWVIIGITDMVDKNIVKSFDWLPCPYILIYVLHENSPDFLSLSYQLSKWWRYNEKARRFDVRSDLTDKENASLRMEFHLLKERLDEGFNFVDAGLKFTPYKGRCYSANLKPFLCNDGNIYCCCIDLKDGDFNKDRIICSWDKVKEEFFDREMIVDCKNCSRVEKHFFINDFLQDPDIDFIL